MSGRIEAKLVELGIRLPTPMAPIASVIAKPIRGLSQVITSGVKN